MEQGEGPLQGGEGFWGRCMTLGMGSLSEVKGCYSASEGFFFLVFPQILLNLLHGLDPGQPVDGIGD